MYQWYCTYILKAQLKRTKFFPEFSMITWTTQEKYYSSYVSKWVITEVLWCVHLNESYWAVFLRQWYYLLFSSTPNEIWKFRWILTLTTFGIISSRPPPPTNWPKVSNKQTTPPPPHPNHTFFLQETVCNILNTFESLSDSVLTVQRPN